MILKRKPATPVLFTEDQLEELRTSYATIDKMGDAAYKKVADMLDKMTDAQLKQVRNARIKFLSLLAITRCTRRGL